MSAEHGGHGGGGVFIKDELAEATEPVWEFIPDIFGLFINAVIAVFDVPLVAEHAGGHH